MILSGMIITILTLVQAFTGVGEDSVLGIHTIRTGIHTIVTGITITGTVIIGTDTIRIPITTHRTIMVDMAVTIPLIPTGQ